jgi:hypothetical protein
MWAERLLRVGGRKMRAGFSWGNLEGKRQIEGLCYNDFWVGPGAVSFSRRTLMHGISCLMAG